MSEYYTTHGHLVKFDDDGKVVWEYGGEEIEELLAELERLQAIEKAGRKVIKRYSDNGDADFMWRELDWLAAALDKNV